MTLYIFKKKPTTQLLFKITNIQSHIWFQISKHKKYSFTTWKTETISGELKQAEIKKKKKNSKEKLFRQTVGKQFSPIIKEERDK